MNEQIKELDKQAKIWAIDNTTYPISSHIPPGYTQKFAELIVKETMQVVADRLPSSVYLDVAEAVIEHFRVKE